MESKKKITVVGSANYDTFLKIDRSPEIGETISSTGISYACGGKGSNQAVAIGNLDYPVEFIGQVGNDTYGQILLNELKNHYVDVSNVKKCNDSTGQAYILSFPNSDNSIVIVGGANIDWKDNDLLGMRKALSESKFLLLQREIPESINIQACKIAKEYNITTILDVGGADTPMSDELLGLLDIISPNKTELRRILERDVDVNNPDDLIKSVNVMRTRGGNPNLCLLLKLGSKGCMYINEKNEILRQNAYHFEDLPIVDTTGAGDCFTASFVAKLSEDKDIQECMKFATACAYLSITVFGAMPSMPTIDKVEAVLKRI